MQLADKRQQLYQIEETLQQLAQLKQTQKQIKTKIQNLKQQKDQYNGNIELEYQTQMLMHYQIDDKLALEKDQVYKQCEQQFKMIDKECIQNRKEIEDQLTQKYKTFRKYYEQIKQKVRKYQKKIQIEKNQQVQQEKLLEELQMEKLKEKDRSLQIQTNDQNAKLTRTKKQIQRYLHRKYFLENKQKFFQDESYFCNIQKKQLMDVKSNLQYELGQIEDSTHKKEKKIRQYFKENQLLSKFKSIHQHLKSTTNRQIQFLQEEKLRVKKNIGKIQSQLAQISLLNSKYDQSFINITNQINRQQNEIKYKKQKLRFIRVMNNQIMYEIKNFDKSLNQNQKIEQYSRIYKKYYIENKLESLVSMEIEGNLKDKTIIIIEQQQKKKESNVQQQLVRHKENLDNKIKLFKKHTLLNKEQMNLSYLKYQAQNYNLIAECNIRKQQALRKKRVLYELIDSVKQTQLYMSGLQRFPSSQALKVNSKKAIPYLDYQKALEQSRKVTKCSQIMRKQTSQSTLKGGSSWNIRKLLQIHQLNKPQNDSGRRIKTAMNKHKISTIVDEEDLNKIQSKPMTAHHQRSRFIVDEKKKLRNKSSSKPTNCTFISKAKYSIV